jgi:hypothetical protein
MGEYDDENIYNTLINKKSIKSKAHTIWSFEMVTSTFPSPYFFLLIYLFNKHLYTHFVLYNNNADTMI